MSERIPSIGTPVVFFHNGIVKPGIVQTVWSPGMVNIRVFEFDPHADSVVTSVPHIDLPTSSRTFAWDYVDE
jgi:hypothetical protein